MTGILMPLPWSGVVAANVSIDEYSVTGTQRAGYSLEPDGDISIRTTLAGTYDPADTWIDLPGDAGLYEARAVLVEAEAGGSLSGTFNTWVSLAGGLTVELAMNVLGESTYRIISIEIRRASTGAIVDAASITLTASR